MQILKEKIVRYETDGSIVKGYDAGELIRCKDCKYYKVYELLGGTLPLCNRIRTSMTDAVEPDDFCSKAERAEE